MGARLVSAAINPHWSGLTHLQHRVLVVMALTALDAGNGPRPAGVYWAGHSYLALCIFGTDQPSRAQLSSIKRALSGLIKAGAIERAEVATGHRRARYRLVLDQFRLPAAPDYEPPGPVDNFQVGDTTDAPFPSPPAEVGDTTDAPYVQHEMPPKLRFRVPKTMQVGDTTDAPGGTIKEPEGSEDLNRGDIHHLSAQAQVSASEPVDNPGRCAACGRRERDCRTRAARHGNHEYISLKLA